MIHQKKLYVSGPDVSAIGLACDRARCSGAGIDLRMGALCRQIGPHYRHEDVRSLGAAQGVPEKVRGSGRERVGRTGMETVPPVRHLFAQGGSVHDTFSPSCGNVN